MARLAGVSQATVSYVINDVPLQRIPEPTRARVLAAADTLGFRPSAHARALRRGRSENVLLLLPDWPVGSAITELLETLSGELAAHGLSLLVHQGSGQLSAHWRDLAPAGVISLDPMAVADDTELGAAGIPFAVTLHESGLATPRTVAVPHDLIGRMQVEHLIATGHRRLGYAAAADPRLRTFLNPRLKGARAACRRRGLPPPVVQRMPLDAGAARAAVEAWREQCITAVCAYNDEFAFAVLSGARAAGLKVPSELAVIGVDDGPLAPFAVPPLTTIKFGFVGIARQLARLVIEGSARSDRSDAVDVSLIVRESA